MERANRIDLALEHIPASSLAKDQLSLRVGVEAEELLQETSKEDGIWGKAEWYYFAGDKGISADVADQLWYWYHPDEYDGDLYENKRADVNDE